MSSLCEMEDCPEPPVKAGFCEAHRPKRQYTVKDPCVWIKQDGNQCGKPKVKGHERCWTHEGCSSPKRAKVVRKEMVLAEPEVQKLLLELKDVEPVDDPVMVMRRGIARYEQAADFYAAQVEKEPTDEAALRHWMACQDRAQDGSAVLVRLGIDLQAVKQASSAPAELKALLAGIAERRLTHMPSHEVPTFAPAGVEETEDSAEITDAEIVEEEPVAQVFRIPFKRKVV